MADAAAAINTMDMATDKGCLRYTFDTAFPSIVMSPLAIAWIAHGENAPVPSVWKLSLIDPGPIAPLTCALIASIYSVD
jgi:hypothetical protein